MNPEDLQEARGIVSQQWQVQIPDDAPDTAAWEMLLDALAERIAHLLEADQPKLMRALYVLDVPEKNYNNAMAKKTTAKAARALAQAVLERETEKIASRRKYAREKAARLDELQP